MAWGHYKQWSIEARLTILFTEPNPDSSLPFQSQLFSSVLIVLFVRGMYEHSLTYRKNMKQVQFKTYGSADVLEVVENPMPELLEDEVLIQVEAAGINYSDILRRRNTYFMPTPLPYRPGVEAVGKIIEPATPTGSLPKGERVLAILPYGGGYAEFVKAHAQYCIPVPDQVSSNQATALFVQGTTAYLMINQLAGELEDQTVLVHAAAGGVGTLLVQLAKQKGAKVIATVGSDEKLELPESLSADATINYNRPGWVEHVRQSAKGGKVDVIFEMVGGSIFEESITCLQTGGHMIIYGQAGPEKGMFHSEQLVDEGLRFSGFNLAHFMGHQFEKWQQAMEEVLMLVATEKLRVTINDIFSLDQVADAHTLIENRKNKGKVVLIP